MASDKNTFESGTFLAATFGAGSWRGSGVTVGSREGSEYAAAGNRLHFAIEGEPAHATAGGLSAHYAVAGSSVTR